MAEKMIQVHKVFGISDERLEEISKGVFTALTRTNRMDAGMKELAEIYPAEALLAGMRLMQAIDMNRALREKELSDMSRMQNAELN